MKAKRLKYLADFLRLLDPVRLDMRAWASHRGVDALEDLSHPVKKGQRLKVADLVQCNMAACALGWAASLDVFRKEGLMLKVADLDAEEEDDRLCAQPMYKGMSGYDAAQKFFGLSWDQTHDVFDFGRYLEAKPTPAAVAARIDAILTQG